jgi:hypothetical protein
MRFYLRTEFYRLRGRVKTRPRGSGNFLFLKFFSVHVDAGRVRADALTFFLGGWKCEWGVDLGYGRKHFFDQISNPIFEEIMIGFGHFYFIYG